MLLAVGLGALGCAVPTKIGELPGTDTVASDGASDSASDSESSVTTTDVEPTTSSTTVDPTDGSTGVGETEGPTGPGPQMSLAILFGDIPDDPGGTGGTSTGTSTTGGGGVPDDTLLVQITTGYSSCTDVYAPLPCGGAWVVSFSLPIELQVPGTYPLFPDVNGLYFFNDQADGTGECGGGGGTLEGTVIIESIDDAQVVGHIEMANAFDFDANVSFVAPRC
jgi:hypothetical protein